MLASNALAQTRADTKGMVMNRTEQAECRQVRGARSVAARFLESRRAAHGSFERLAAYATRVTGSSFAFILVAAVVVAWAASGPAYGYSDGWQLVINTGTTIVTFLMVFLIQHAQNKDSRAVHLKLDELLASHARASNRLVAIEDLDEESLERLHRFYCQLADLAERAGGFDDSRSPEGADDAGSGKRRIQDDDGVPPQ